MNGAPAFLRFSRDRRGYEHFYLIESTTNRRGKTRARVLYWFRTPPGVKVGRPPFDAEMQRAIEARNPGVSFDWKRILATPIPPPAPDVERWRDRRRAERAERAARRTEQGSDAAVDGEEPGSPEPRAPEADAHLAVETVPAEAGSAAEAGSQVEADSDAEADSHAEADNAPVESVETLPSTVAVAFNGVPAASAHKRRRRRRRGGRGRGPMGAPAGPAAPASEGTVASPIREHAPQHRDEPQGE